VIVRIPGLLRSYTAGAETVTLPTHATLDDALRDLDVRFPGLRFRIIDEQNAIRPHIKLFVDGELARRLSAPVALSSELMIVGALSGGLRARANTGAQSIPAAQQPRCRCERVKTDIIRRFAYTESVPTGVVARPSDSATQAKPNPHRSSGGRSSPRRRSAGIARNRGGVGMGPSSAALGGLVNWWPPV
jgi:hypothetical protein